jgi:outer membrane lipoprotein-sorting protein
MHSIAGGSRSERFSIISFWTLVFLFGLITQSKSQNKYDVLARTLQPYTALFSSRSPVKALQADVVLTQTGSADAHLFVDRPTRVSLQMPDKIRLETLDPEHKTVFWRNDQRVWIFPKDLADRLIAEAGPPERSSALPDFRLPFKDQQLVLLAALFQITRFSSRTDRDGNPAWDLEVRLAPEIAPKTKQWVGNLVVRQKDFQLEQLSLQSSEVDDKLDVLSTQFRNSLPSDLFEPDLEGATEIPAPLMHSILGKLSWIIGTR